MTEIALKALNILVYFSLNLIAFHGDSDH